MATTPKTTRETVNEAASEASRATSEASQRTLQSAQDAVQTMRAYLEQSIAANRKLLDAYAQWVEATIKGGFQLQNTVLGGGMSVLDKSAESSHDLAQQLTEAVGQAQQATLEAWQAGVGATDKVLGSGAESAETAGREETPQGR
jgi:hypothetical protein